MLVVDVVSVAKSARLPPSLAGIDVLFLNLDEARAITKKRDTTRAAVLRLLRAGAGAVIVTRGAGGALVADPGGIQTVPARTARAIDVTGAGDALIAGTLFRLLAREELTRAVETGTILAALTIETPTSVWAKLTPRRLAAAARRMTKAGKGGRR
jgi:pseudouridine kinase